MKDNQAHLDLWVLPLLLLWAVFFVSGLFPAETFHLLRRLGMVLPHRALVNSPHLITISFSCYLAYFAYRRCAEYGLGLKDAYHRALYVSLMSLIAFLDFPMAVLFNMPQRLASTDQTMMYIIGGLKVFFWIYLYISVLRYNALGNPLVFVSMMPKLRLKTMPPVETHKPSQPMVAEPGQDNQS